MVKITPKTGESSKVQQKIQDTVLQNNKKNTAQVTSSGDSDPVMNAIMDWHGQNQSNVQQQLSGSIDMANQIELTDYSTSTQQGTSQGVSNRVTGLMSGTSNHFNQSSISNTKESNNDMINPFLPIQHVKELPSSFIPYKLIVKNPEIFFKPYKFGEIKKMNQSKMSVRQLFKEVLTGIECNFDKELITLADFTYIGLMRRLATLRTAKFNASFSCQACGTQNKQEFDHSKLLFENLKCELPITVDFNGKDYHFTPLTIKDYLLLYDLEKLDDQIAYYAIQCRNTDIVIDYPVKDENGVKLTDEMRRFYTVYNIFYNLTSAEDGEVLDMLEGYLDHKLQAVVLNCVGLVSYEDEEGNTKHNKCNNPINVTLDGGGVVITPFRESNESVKSRIRFGVKRDS